MGCQLFVLAQRLASSQWHKLVAAFGLLYFIQLDEYGSYGLSNHKPGPNFDSTQDSGSNVNSIQCPGSSIYNAHESDSFIKPIDSGGSNIYDAYKWSSDIHSTIG